MYDYKKTLVKGATIVALGGISALASYLSGLPQTEVVIIGTAVLTMALNWLKHKEN